MNNDYFGYIGGFIGLLGGLIGTYASIHNSNGLRERAFMIKCSAVCWVFVIGFLAGLYLIPAPWKWALWIPYTLLLVWGIQAANQEQERIRSEEENQLRH